MTDGVTIEIITTDKDSLNADQAAEKSIKPEDAEEIKISFSCPRCSTPLTKTYNHYIPGEHATACDNCNLEIPITEGAFHNERVFIYPQEAPVIESQIQKLYLLSNIAHSTEQNALVKLYINGGRIYLFAFYFLSLLGTFSAFLYRQFINPSFPRTVYITLLALSLVFSIIVYFIETRIQKNILENLSIEDLIQYQNFYREVSASVTEK